MLVPVLVDWAILVPVLVEIVTFCEFVMFPVLVDWAILVPVLVEIVTFCEFVMFIF